MVCVEPVGLFDKQHEPFQTLGVDVVHRGGVLLHLGPVGETVLAQGTTQSLVARLLLLLFH
jgi:hypothetical protein